MGDRRASVLKLVARFEQWSKDADVKPEEDVPTDPSDEEGLEDLSEEAALKVKIERKGERIRKKVEKERKNQSVPAAGGIAAGEAARRAIAFQAKAAPPSGSPTRPTKPLPKAGQTVQVGATTGAAARIAQPQVDSGMDPDAAAGAPEEEEEEVPDEYGPDDVVAYWDEESETWWYTDEQGRHYFWDEDTQTYRRDLGLAIEEAQLELAELRPTGAAKGPYPEYLTALAEECGLPVETLERLERGIKTYAYVKAHGGMLKPLMLYFRAFRGRIYIVRNNKSQFLHVSHVGELNTAEATLDALANSPEGEKHESPLKGQPAVVFFTNETYHQQTKKKKGPLKMPTALKKALKKPLVHRKSLVFVFEEFEDRDDVVAAVAAVAKREGIAMDVVE